MEYEIVVTRVERGTVFIECDSDDAAIDQATQMGIAGTVEWDDLSVEAQITGEPEDI